MKMKLFLLILLVGYAACDDIFHHNPTKEPLKVYWNVPTFQCDSKKIPFENLYERFGIIQNENDEFDGDKIAFLYNPGLMPAIIRNEITGSVWYRNGGVPQNGDLMEHLLVFAIDLALKIPDKDFSGVGVIGYDEFQPIFRQNFANLEPYKILSYKLEKERHEHWHHDESQIEAEAEQRFEKAAKLFMESTLLLAKELRPNARWGFYGFPYCYNMATNTMIEECAARVPEENDQLEWLWSESDALHPSVYSNWYLTTSQTMALIRGRINEAKRVAAPDTEILPYFHLLYRNGGFFTERDLNAALWTFSESNATGFIVWGSSHDVNTHFKCHELLHYVEHVFGPAVVKYTKPRHD